VIESLDTFEQIADAARMVSLDMDGGRWTLGDLANQCARKWGENTIGDLAAEIRIASKKTLYQYAKVSARFDLSTRVAFQDAPLTFSHYRAAMVAGADAELWLAKAADDVLSVAALAREIKIATGKPVPPRKLWEGDVAVGLDSDGDRMLYFCQDPFTGLEMHKTYRAVVYEAEAANE
jgi:hypothetical protein